MIKHGIRSPLEILFENKSRWPAKKRMDGFLIEVFYADRIAQRRNAEVYSDELFPSVEEF